ncbi:MAG: glycosyltransferase family 4 protein [Candidatus Acidiferrales bacterium]|jgi:glycosyltransferase involved in cell wall biosynthesis
MGQDRRGFHKRAWRRAGGIVKLILYAHSWAPSVGGVETATMILARGLAEWAAAHAGEEVAVTLVTRTPANGMDDSALPFQVARRPGIGELIRLVREADVVHIAGPCLMPAAIAWLMRKPAVIEHHGHQAICPNGLLFKQPSQTLCPGHFAARQYRECLRCCSSTEGLAGGLRTLLLTFPRRWLSGRLTANIMISNRLGARLELPRSTTIYYGIPDATPVSMESTRSASNGFEIAYVGRLVAEKGLPLLLEAAQWMKQQGVAFKLSFIGGGSERVRLGQMAERLGLSDCVTFTGDLRGADLEKTVGKIAVVVMPSVWEETAGLSAIEQMMRGRVVIAADIGGLGEVVDGGGLKFAPGDWRALAACMQKVAADPELAKSLGSAARSRAMRMFRQDSMIQAHLSLYREVSR